MVHHRQGLSLGLEPRQHLPRIHPRLDDLECHAPPHGRLLFGHVDDAEAAFADRFEEFVRPDHRPGHLFDRFADHSLTAGSPCLLVASRFSAVVLDRAQQILDLAKLGIIARHDQANPRFCRSRIATAGDKSRAPWNRQQPWGRFYPNERANGAAFARRLFVLLDAGGQITIA